MNEMNLLEEFCAAVPAPDTARLSGARRQLQAAAQPPHRTRTRTRTRSWTWRATAVAAAGTAAVLVAALTSGAPAQRVQAPATATQLLQRAATAALTVPVAAADQFIYTQGVGPAIEITGTARHQKIGPTIRETQQMWTSVNGTRPGAIYMTKPCALLTGGGQPPPPVTYAECHPGIQANGEFYGGLDNYAAMEKLPTSPSALLSYIRHYYAASYATRRAAWTKGKAPFPPVTENEWDWHQFTLAIAVVGLLPPQTGAAIYQALAEFPGVFLIRNVTDYAGRHGIAVAMRLAPTEVDELIFDPSTYQLIGTQTMLGTTVQQAYALIRTAIVDSAPPGAPGDYY